MMVHLSLGSQAAAENMQFLVRRKPWSASPAGNSDEMPGVDKPATLSEEGHLTGRWAAQQEPRACFPLCSEGVFVGKGRLCTIFLPNQPPSSEMFCDRKVSRVQDSPSS